MASQWVIHEMTPSDLVSCSFRFARFTAQKMPLPLRWPTNQRAEQLEDNGEYYKPPTRPVSQAFVRTGRDDNSNSDADHTKTEFPARKPRRFAG